MREFIVMALVGFGVEPTQAHLLATGCAERLNAMQAN